jgi:hypothetical protein
MKKQCNGCNEFFEESELNLVSRSADPETGEELEDEEIKFIYNFDEYVREAFRSEEVQKAVKELGEKFDPNRTYPHATKA